MSQAWDFEDSKGASHTTHILLHFNFFVTNIYVIIPDIPHLL